MSYTFHHTHKASRPIGGFLGERRCRACGATKSQEAALKPCPKRHR